MLSLPPLLISTPPWIMIWYFITSRLMGVSFTSQYTWLVHLCLLLVPHIIQLFLASLRYFKGVPFCGLHFSSVISLFIGELRYTFWKAYELNRVLLAIESSLRIILYLGVAVTNKFLWLILTLKPNIKHDALADTIMQILNSDSLAS